MSDIKQSTETSVVIPEEPKTSHHFLYWLVVLIVVAFSAATVAYLIVTKPKPQRKAPVDGATLVEAREVTADDYTAVIEAMGLVIPAREVTLSAQIAGEVISVDSENYLPGGVFSQGEKILDIDPEDYQLAVKRLEAELKQKQAALVSKQSDLKLEQGKQLVARQEFELLGEKIDEQDSSLVLRKPQLMAAEAEVDSARAAMQITQVQLEQAKLDLARASVAAPFNCVVMQRFAETGTYLNAGSQIATLASTDEFWVEVALPTSSVGWINIPTASDQSASDSSAIITKPMVWTDGQHRGGRVLRLAAELDSTGRMAKVLVSVPNPLNITGEKNLPAVLLGDYLRVAITGRKMENVYRIAQSSLHEGGKIWVMNESSELEIRQVEKLWSDGNYVYLAEGLTDGEIIVTSDIAAPVIGMKLRVGDKQNAAAADMSAEVK